MWGGRVNSHCINHYTETLGKFAANSQMAYS